MCWKGWTCLRLLKNDNLKATKRKVEERHFEEKYGCFQKLGYHPKSSILIGFGTIINHPFWGTTIFGNTHILISKDFMIGPPAVNQKNLPCCLSMLASFSAGTTNFAHVENPGIYMFVEIPPTPSKLFAQERTAHIVLGREWGTYGGLHNPVLRTYYFLIFPVGVALGG